MGKEDSKDDLITIREASRILNVHGNTLRGWTRQGTLKAHRINARGDRRFKREDIAALLKK
jgi:excisionase family DNA binding protein